MPKLDQQCNACSCVSPGLVPLQNSCSRVCLAEEIIQAEHEIESGQVAFVMQPSNSQGSDETPGSKKRSSFLGRPLKELEDLW